MSPERVERAYRYADLSAYSWTERLQIRAAGLVFYLIIKLIGSTIRFEVEGGEYEERVKEKGRLPIYVLWHNRTFLGTYWFRKRGIVVLTSKSFDGEYIARFIQRFGFGAVRGSSTRGGIGAIAEMVRMARAGYPTAMTPDGPKGPLYVAKLGTVLLAKKSGHPMVPLSVTPARYWRLPSWDGYYIAKPFTRATVQMAAPIFVPADASQEVLEAKRQELQSALDRMNP